MVKKECGWILKTVLPSSQLKSSLEFRISGQTILLLNYGSRLELHTSVYNQIEKSVSTELQVSIPLPGPIEHLKFLGENKVLVINSKSQFQVLSLSPQAISVLLRGTLEDGVRRPLDRGALLCVDPWMRFFIYVSTQGVMRLVPLVYRGLDVYLGSVQNCRLLELNVIDMAITHHPKLSDTLIVHVLCQESASQYKLERYWVDWSAPSVFSPERHITHQPNAQMIQMSQPQKLVVLPNQLDLLVFAADGVSLYTADDKHLSVRTALIKYTAFKAISDQMVVCGDVEGKLYTLQRFGENIRLQFLGKAEPCVCLEYLGEAMVWCGAAPGFTSQIVHFTAEPNSRGEYLKSLVPWGSELGSSLFSDAFLLTSETILASCTSRMPFPPKSALWMIKEGYGCRLTEAVELETGGAPLTKLFHVTMDSTLYFVVGDASGKRVVLDYQKGFQPAQQLETSSLELLRGARGLRMSNRGEFYSFSEKSVFLIAPRMELLYKAPPSGNPIRNVDVYEDVCVVHSQNDLMLGPVGWAWKHNLLITSEIAALTLGRCSPEEYVLAVVDWTRTLRVYAFDSLRIERRFEVQLVGCVAPRDVCVLSGEFVVVGDARGQLFTLRVSGSTGEVEVIQLGNGPIKFEPFLDRIVILGKKPSVLSVVHGIIDLKPLNLPALSAFVDMGMGAFAAITCESNVLINGTIEIDNPFGKQITKVDMEEYCENVCALEGNPSMVAVATHGRDAELSKVRLLGGPEMKPLDAFMLLPNETITSMCTSSRLEDAPIGDLIIIGTSFTTTGAWEEYEQMEAEKGRLVILGVGERKKLKLLGALEVEGGVNAVQVCHGKLVACVNANNCVYKWSATAAISTSSPPHSLSSLKGTLQCLTVTPGQIMGVSLSVLGTNVLVGDLLKSLTLYGLEEGKKLSLVMNDVSSHWILSTHLLGNSDEEEVALASDTFGNVLLYRTATDPFIANRKILAVSSGYFLGSLVNKILPKKEGGLLLIGESGQMWELKRCDDFGFLAKLEDILAGRLTPVHHQHRQIYEKTPSSHTAKTKKFIDGDLVIRFMELPYKEKEEIATLLGTTAPVITQLLQK